MGTRNLKFDEKTERMTIGWPEDSMFWARRLTNRSYRTASISQPRRYRPRSTTVDASEWTCSLVEYSRTPRDSKSKPKAYREVLASCRCWMSSRNCRVSSRGIQESSGNWNWSWRNLEVGSDMAFHRLKSEAKSVT